jgi:uncharacterized Zn finger protein
MTKNSSISATFSCANCGGTLETAEDNPTDDSIVKCKSCGQIIGTYGVVHAKGRKVLMAEAEAVRSKAIKGFKTASKKKR